MMEALDLDSLLRLHADTESDDEPSAVPDQNRTVDEILLNHSPSPPSSPSTTHNYFRRSENPRFLPTSSSAVGSDKYNSAAGTTNGNRTNHAGRVLPQLFSGGVMRSNSKPGAALAAAVAASRSIPTPHATAIKLRRTANSGIALASAKVASSAVDSTASDDGSDVGVRLDTVLSSESQQEVTQEKDDIELGQFISEQFDSIAEKADLEQDRVVDGAAEVMTRTKTVNEAVEDRTYYLDQERAEPIFETQSDSSFENEKVSVLDDVNVNEQGLSPSVNEQDTQVFDESGENYRLIVSTPTSEDKSGGEETSDTRNVISEPGDGDDVLSQSDVPDFVEDLVSEFEKKSDDTKSQKVSDSSLKPLDLAEEIEKKQAFTALHYEEGAAAQPMRLEGLRKDSTVLGYFDVNSNNAITRTISSQPFQRDHGSAQVVSVHINYIAIGTSKGSIFVVPSKYTAHHVDSMDAKMTLLGLQGDRSFVPVTSMCFNQQGDLLFAGYGDGHYTVWDVQKSSALKVITEHRAPVVHMLYLGQDTQVTRQFNVLSGDSKGVVKLIRFSVVPWLNRISYTKPVILFDETTSRVVCASPLLYGESHEGLMMSTQSSSAVSSGSGSMMGGMVDEGVVIFITHQSALVAKVIPSVKVYGQIPKPDGVREDAMPYAAWKCMSLPRVSSSESAPVETSDNVSMLAIAWDKKIQIAKLVKSELKVIQSWTLENPAVGLTWLDDQMLVVLTLTAQFYLFTKDGNVIHQTSFSVDGFQGDDLMSYHLFFTNAFGNPEKSYQNSVAVRGATIYILGTEHLVVSRFLSWKERIEVLRIAGDWMGALNMAITLYDGKTHGVIDLPKNLDDIQKTLMPYLVELLLSYVNEVFSYISVACYNQNGKLEQSDETKEQYIRVGGVAVEFCVHIRRTDILFEDVLSKFNEAHQKETFLELLEPYILKDMLGLLPPVIMQALVEHYSKRGWLLQIEQCVLHMDMLSLDFNQVVRLCREHRLHGALIYLFNKGLNDFRTPLEELLAVLWTSSGEIAASLGYRILVYLKYCFQGLAFPPGRGIISSTRLPSLRKELLHFLLEDSSAPNASGVTSLTFSGSYANLLHLLELDTEATIDVLKCALTEDEIPRLTHSEESADSTMESGEIQRLIQKIVDILADVLDAGCLQTGSPICTNDSTKVWPSNEDVDQIYDFIAYYVASKRANVSRSILSQILEYLTSEVYISDNLPGEVIQIKKMREQQLLSLLQAVPETHWDVLNVLLLCEKVQFHKVCGYIHAIRHQYVAAMESYMKVTNEPIYAFSFIHDMLKRLNKEESDDFESAVISTMPGLVKLSREGTYFLMIDHFLERTQFIISELRSHPESLFLYLKTVIEVHKTGTLNLSSLEKADFLDFPSAMRAQQQSTGVQTYLEALSGFLKLVRSHPVHVTDEMTELYFELLCQYDSKSVLRFLETSESYRVEHCLRLCQEYGIVDAASFLLERVGNVGSALLLVLSDLSDKFIMLDAAIQKGGFATSLDNLNTIVKKKEVAEILDTVRACVGLCQRNSPQLEEDESEYLWFQLLESFCEPLMDSGNASTDFRRKALKDTLDGSLGELDDEEGRRVKWKFSKSRKGAHTMRKLLSIFIKEIVEGMIGYVRLPRIMLKLLSDNGKQEFGDFKHTILGMLGTYDFERRILDTAKSLIEDDTYYTMSLLAKGASHGYAPRSLICCICNSSIAKISSDFSIQVFSCGHTMHLHCEVQDNTASFRSTLTGCPICTPRKQTQSSRGKSVGLVTNSSSRTQVRGGPPFDHDNLDNSYSSQPAPRFELLNNLQRDQKLAGIESMPHLRLAPPAVYHEKVNKRIDMLGGESSSRVSTAEKPNSRRRVFRDVKLKGSSIRFPLKSSIFSKEKITRR